MITLFIVLVVLSVLADIGAVIFLICRISGRTTRRTAREILLAFSPALALLFAAFVVGILSQ